MRVLAAHPDLIVFISRAWQTTCTAVRSGGECFVIDSPVFPDELDALEGVLDQAGFPVSGLLSTHADWDHLLGPIAFPGTSLGCGASTADRIAAEPGAAQRALRAYDEEHYIQGRAPLALAAVQSLPLPGRVSLGSSGRELELHPAGGHTSDGTAYWIPWLGVLVCGDYLSPIEIPAISAGGSVGRYLATLDQLRPLVQAAVTVVPGHGGPLDRDAALSGLEEDATYLTALAADGAAAPLPPGRRTRTQRRIHAENAGRAGAADPPGRSPTRRADH